MEPQPPFRSFSHSSSSASLSNLSASVSRVSAGPLQTVQNLNKLSSPVDHLHGRCLSLRARLASIDGMEPFLKAAYDSAEQCAEQQALVLAQQQQEKSAFNDFRASVDSNGFSLHSDNSASTSIAHGATQSIFTFTAGVIPTVVRVDPTTQMWKLFQQGAPLCLLFNSVDPKHQIPIAGSDDVRMCKKSVYDFLIAVKTHLSFDDDMMFTISNVFSDSTHDFLRVVDVVDKLLPTSAKNDPEALVEEIKITDNASKVFKELVETERKYVQDLELMLKYKKELHKAELLSDEQIDALFPNINDIIDFQRRLLNGLECNINIKNTLQRIGSIFIHASNGPFLAYEPWIIGQLTAIDLINKETANLQKSSSLLDPGFELQSFILKPIQRLCKYPLLLKELVKTTTQEDTPMYNELVTAFAAMKDVANHVNEAQRKSENIGHLQNLTERVANWRGFNIREQGELLYHGVVGVRDSENEKEYFAYLFEKIIFFFIEVNKEEDSGVKKKRDLLSSRKKSSSSVSSSTVNLLENLNHAKDKTPLELKGRVYIAEIYNISSSNNHGYTMIISWSGKKESGSFSLRYRTEELRNQWENCLRNLKTNEMNNQIQRKLRDSRDSHESITPYEPAHHNTQAETGSSRSSNGSSYQRHHSSSSTFSMMRQSRSKSTSEPSTFRTSSSSLQNAYNMVTNDTSFSSTSSSKASMVSIKIIYGKIEIPSALTVSTVTAYPDLYSKISSKIASSSEVNDDIMVNKLKYKDEDGDFVVMDSNDDWTLALDMLDEMGESDKQLTIWVS